MSLNKFYNLLSYTNIVNDIEKFRTGVSGKTVGVGYEDPSTLYFKVFFYFNSDSIDGDTGSNLLSLPPIRASHSINLDGVNNTGGYVGELSSSHSDKGGGNSYFDYISNTDDDNNIDWTSRYSSGRYSNTAMDFLAANGEVDRMKYLYKFITTLSSLSANTPWVFQKITGLADVMKNPVDVDEGFKIGETDKKITIECLGDSFDQRISSLLGLYRAVVSSKVLYKEVVPRNLRKFDMGIYIFPAPNWRYRKGGKEKGSYVGTMQDLAYTVPTDNSGSIIRPQVSSRYIELHDCEFDINNSTDVLDTLDNAGGVQHTYNIKISVGSAYEQDYNQFLDLVFGDLVLADERSAEAESKPSYAIPDNTKSLNQIYGVHPNDYVTNNVRQSDSIVRNYNHTYEDGRKSFSKLNKLIEKIAGSEGVENKIGVLDGYPGTKPTGGILSNTVGTGVNFVKNKVDSVFKKLWLGNLYGLSVSSMYQNLASGNVGVESIGRLRGEIADVSGKTKYGDKTKLGQFWENSMSAIQDATTMVNNPNYVKSSQTGGSSSGKIVFDRSKNTKPENLFKIGSTIGEEGKMKFDFHQVKLTGYGEEVKATSNKATENMYIKNGEK